MHMLARSFVLLLWTQTLTFVKCQDCTRQQFIESTDFDRNFDISGMSATYGAGKQVRVPCNTGYTGFFKLICTEGKWKPVGSKCEAKSCGHPGDAQFADFNLQNGEDFVFGSEVAYTCHQGYFMVSRSNIRRCVADGWDGVVPVCEAIKCPAIHVENNVQVIGDPEEATFGNVLRFTCRQSSEVLSGSTEIYCNERGEWKGTVPICKEVSCPIPVVQHGYVDGGRQEYKENDLLLNFHCDLGYIKTDERYSKCSKTGDRAEWIPTPACKLITCELSLPPLMGTSYDTQNKNVFSPRETVRVTCGETFYIENPKKDVAVVTCKENGKWSIDPVCKEVTCPNYLQNDYLYYSVNAWGNNKFGDKVSYSCKWGYKNTNDAQYATCTRDGWEPSPLCTAKTCPKPELGNAEIIRGERTFYAYSNGEQVEYRCKNGAQSFTATCEEGTWTGTKGCLATLRQCSTPAFRNADITSGAKYNYYDNDRVIYKCKNGAQKSFTATCEDGTWTKNKGCLACTKPDIPNGFVVGPFNDSVIYYSCNENYKLFTKSWWAEATCVDGEWTDLHQCIEEASCGEAPVIPNGRGEPVKPPGGPVSLRIVCNEGYDAGINQLTCLNGAWNLQGVKLETVCRRDAKSCNRPPYLENAIINGPNQMKYSPGSSVTYQCREKFTIKRENSITCKDGKWGKKDIICVKYCEILKDVRLTVTTSDTKQKYLEDETINYVCKAPGSNTELAMCSNGTWVKTVDCPAVPCQVGVLSPGLGISGTRPSSNRVTPGEKLHFVCGEEFDLEGSAETKCLETGQWSLPLPTCSKKCILQLPENVIITSPTGSVSRSKGQKITFGCRQRGHYINGIETIECLENGEWSSQPPTCERRDGCGTPPALNDGDTEGFTKSSYDNGETVNYVCFRKFVMEGGPTKVCNNGAWTGTITCKKPCTVNEEMMNMLNIQFASSYEDKLYATHNDHITFVCKRGTRKVSAGQMRKKCNNGEMELPRCQ